MRIEMDKLGLDKGVLQPKLVAANVLKPRAISHVNQLRHSAIAKPMNTFENEILKPVNSLVKAAAPIISVAESIAKLF